MEKDLSINAPSTFECTGCSICKVVCPVDECISIDLNEDGYLIAYSDKETCINCNQCQQVCYKFQDVHNIEYKTPLEVYTATNRDKEIQYQSSSGGIATALFSAGIDLGYTIVGAMFNTTINRVEHIFIDKQEDLYKIRGSKYLPSFTYDTFSQLKKHTKYIVVGTPCQIGGLAKMRSAKKGYDDILLVDFRCFGHPGYTLFDKYYKHLQEDINSSGIKTINMRSKNVNWHQWGVSIVFNDGKKYFKNKFNDLFASAFITGETVHDVCLTCDIYKNATHADIRVEDAWAFVQNQPQETLKNGLSQIGVFSQKGQKLFEKVKENINYKPVEFDYSQGEWMKVKRDPEFMENLKKSDLKLNEILELFWKKHPYKKRTHVWQWLNTLNIYKKYLRYLPKPLKEKFIDISVYLVMDLKKSWIKKAK